MNKFFYKSKSFSSCAQFPMKVGRKLLFQQNNNTPHSPTPQRCNSDELMIVKCSCFQIDYIRNTRSLTN